MLKEKQNLKFKEISKRFLRLLACGAKKHSFICAIFLALITFVGFSNTIHAAVAGGNQFGVSGISIKSDVQVNGQSTNYIQLVPGQPFSFKAIFTLTKLTDVNGKDQTQLNLGHDHMQKVQVHANSS